MILLVRFTVSLVLSMISFNHIYRYINHLLVFRHVKSDALFCRLEWDICHTYVHNVIDFFFSFFFCTTAKHVYFYSPRY